MVETIEQREARAVATNDETSDTPTLYELGRSLGRAVRRAGTAVGLSSRDAGEVERLIADLVKLVSARPSDERGLGLFDDPEFWSLVEQLHQSRALRYRRPSTTGSAGAAVDSPVAEPSGEPVVETAADSSSDDESAPAAAAPAAESGGKKKKTASDVEAAPAAEEPEGTSESE
jgi:hypothetical protein